MAQLYDPLGAGKISQRVHAKVGQPGAIWEPVDHQIAGGA